MVEEEQVQINRGLKGVYFDRSKTSFIDGRAGELNYCGYSIHDLAEHASFEETAYLLMHGELPDEAQLQAFDTALKASRHIPAEIYRVIDAVQKAHPMTVLRTAVSALSPFDPEEGDTSVEATRRKGIRLTAQVPIIIAAHHRMRGGLEPVAPQEDLGHAANFLYMLHDEVPGPEACQLMDTDLVLHAEHGSNASSFTARVVAGTEANTHAAMTAAIAALSGSAHGGAAENVMQMAREIGAPEHAEAYVREKRRKREPVMGFWHRVYRAEDPRARHLREGVAKLSAACGQPDWFEILQAVVEVMAPYARRGVNVNVDFYAGVIYHLNGIAEDLFVPIFAMGRVPGWTAQIMEQVENNILIRPLTLYDGPAPRDYVPLDQR